MLGKVFGLLTVSSLAIAMLTGNVSALGNAVLDGASDAITLTLSLAGIMCLWSGVMEVLRDAGAITRLSRLMRPFLKLFFPESYGEGQGAEEIAANVSANLLGIGNAATPFALAAMERMQRRNPNKDAPSGDMITLAVMNTASVNLVPTTLLALRRAAGSQDAFAIIVPIWISSTVCWLVALIFARAAAGIYRQKGKKQKWEGTHDD